MQETKNPTIPESEVVQTILPEGISRTRVLYRGYPKTAIAESETVLTTEGFKLAKDIQITDVILSGEGVPTKISAICKNPKENIYKITFQSGRTLKTSGNAIWAPSQDKNGNLCGITTTQDIYERIQKRKAQNITTPLNIFMPVNRPVNFGQETKSLSEAYLDQITDMDAVEFSKPFPDEYLTSDIDTRTKIIQYLVMGHSDVHMNWELKIPANWNEKFVNQVKHILRSLGYHVQTQPAPDESLNHILKVVTAINLARPDTIPLRMARPMDFRDMIMDIEKMPEQEHTICIAPEHGTYNYIVSDFCIMHTTIYNYHFEQRTPCMPWGATANQNISLMRLYPEYDKHKTKTKEIIYGVQKPVKKKNQPKKTKRRRSIVKKKKNKS